MGTGVIELECMYCGHKFSEGYPSFGQKPRCPVCKDFNIKRVNKTVSKVDYYGEKKPTITTDDWSID